MPNELPQDPDRTLCLAGYLAHAAQPLSGDDLRAAEWLYIREQIISLLNVVELASAYSTHNGKPVSHDAAQSQKPNLSGQEMLIRFVDGALGNDIKSVMRAILPEYNKTRDSDLTLNGLWRICATVDCNEKVRDEESHAN